MKDNFWDKWGGTIGVFGFVAIILTLLFWNNFSSIIAGRGWDPQVAVTCEDVTTYDYNWDNDMLCTRLDGSTFYTDYEGARQAIEKNGNDEQEAPATTTDSSDADNTIPIGGDDQPSVTCEDVTTYDYNWDNDMLCTRLDGSTFYTDYEGARQAELN